MCLMREVVLAVASPLPAPEGALHQQDCLVINTLPFKDDLRQLTFRSFHATDDTKKHVGPSHRRCASCHVAWQGRPRLHTSGATG